MGMQRMSVRDTRAEAGTPSKRPRDDEDLESSDRRKRELRNIL